MDIKPPPLPSSVEDPEPSAFASHAANACLAAPLIIIALSVSLSSLTQNHRDTVGRPLFMIFGLAFLGFLGLGLVLGILSMALARPGQRGSVITRAVIGLALLVVLVAIAVPNLVRAHTLALQRQQALQDLHSAASDFRRQAAASLSNSDPHSPDLRQLQYSLSQAAQKTSGDTAALLRATQLYLQQLQALQHTYQQAADRLLAAKVLTAGTLDQRAQIQDRKALVQKFLDANTAIKIYVTQSDQNYGKELAAMNVPPAQREAAVNGFRKSFSVQVPLLLEIRDSDERMGRAMLGVLNLFDMQWGQWRYDTGAGVVRFQDHNAVGQYNDLMTEISQAGKAQSAAQKRLAAVMSRSTSSL